MQEISNIEIQNKIFRFIKNNPGIHISKIAETLNMNVDEIKKHLDILEKTGKIFFKQEKGFKQFFIRNINEKTRTGRTDDMQQKILNLISQKPGIHLSKIASILEISPQLADYHLLQMEKNSAVISIKNKESYYKRYYIEDIDIGKDDKIILSLLRNEIPLKIVLLLLEYKKLQHKEIYKFLHISPSLLSYHLTKLLNKNIIDVVSHGKDKGYSLNDEKYIKKILRKYDRHLGRQLALENFNETWKDLNLFGK